MKWVVIAVAALLIGLLTYGIASEGTDTTIDNALASGERPAAPDAELPLLGTQDRGRLSDYQGKVVVVNFWASWCPPCVEELPAVQALQDRLAKEGGTVVGINTRDITEDALQWVERNDLTFPSLRDGSGDYAEQWGARQYPESFLIDREGKIRAVKRGVIDDAWIREHVDPLLKS